MGHFGKMRWCNGELPCNHCDKRILTGLTGGDSVTSQRRCTYDLAEGVRKGLVPNKNEETLSDDELLEGNDSCDNNGNTESDDNSEADDISKDSNNHDNSPKETFQVTRSRDL